MQPIRVFDIIARRRVIIFGVVCILLSGVMLGFGLDFYQSAKKAKAVVSNHTMADGEVIKQDDATYDSTDTQVYNITIPAGVTATIDGEHTFQSLTVNGTLTSTDYNSYGVYNSGNPGDNLFENIFSSDDSEYTFIMRGFINVGANPGTWLFSPCSGNPSSTSSYDKPNTMKVDNFASVEFYTPISFDDFDTTAGYWSGTPEGHGYTSISGGLISFDDTFTDANHTLLPFEYRFRNNGGASQFGLCYAAANSTDPASNYYLKTIATPSVNPTEAFDPAALTPEMQTAIAWQGASASDYAGTATDYGQFTTYIENFKSGDNYDPTLFYRADSYDFKSDNKVTVHPDLKILSSDRTLDSQANLQNNFDTYRRIKSSLTTNISSFYPSDWYSPLASRYFQSTDGNARVMHNYQPYLSEALVTTLPIKIPTKLSITDVFRVNSNGIINLNGRGFANTMFPTGSGPGSVSIYAAGGSHSGAGGKSPANTPANATYDTDPGTPPLLPGSGSMGWAYRSILGFIWYYYELTHQYENDHGNGGGFIDIGARTIKLESGSMIMANGVGCDVNEAPAGASGGSVILSDYDSGSYYRGLITAQGASTSRHHGDRTDHAGGGGGYVYITTATNVPNLENLQDTVQHIEHYGAHVPPSQVKYPTWDSYWHDMYGTTSSSPKNVVSVYAGNSEDGAAGAIGIYSVHAISIPQITIKKTLNPISRTSPVSTSSFNPYGLLTADKIKFEIQVTGLTVGDRVNDVAPVSKFSGQKYLCGVISDISPDYGTTGNDLATGSKYVEWVYSGSSSTATFSYTCTIRKE